MAGFVLGEKVISAIDGDADFASVASANVLEAGVPERWSGRRIFWSGWMGESIFARDFRTWSKEGWARLDRWCDGVQGMGSGASVCFRPHARHVLSDPQSCVSFLKKREGHGFEILLDPAGFLTPDMLPRAEDHILRAVEALADHPAVPAMVVCNVERSPEDAELLVPAPIAQGLLSLDHIRMMVAYSGRKPVILTGPGAFDQKRLLDELPCFPRR